MNERIVQVTYDYNPDKDAVLTSIETVDGLYDTQLQLSEGLDKFTQAEVPMNTNGYSSIREKYQTIYNAESTISEFGRRGLAVVLRFPQINQNLSKNAIKAIDEGSEVIGIGAWRNSKEQPAEAKTIYRENGLAYAQDQPETMAYAISATRIINALVAGNETLLGALPTKFQEALRTRIASYKGDIPKDEYEAMISVACNGLAEADGNLEFSQAA